MKFFFIPTMGNFALEHVKDDAFVYAFTLAISERRYPTAQKRAIQYSSLSVSPYEAQRPYFQEGYFGWGISI